MRMQKNQNYLIGSYIFARKNFDFSESMNAAFNKRLFVKRGLVENEH